MNPAKSVKDTYSFKEGTDATFYIINYEEGGWIMISADDRVLPILAYGEKGTIPLDKLNSIHSGLDIWLKGTSKGILKTRLINASQTKAVRAGWEEMEIKSKLSSGKNVQVVFPDCLEEGQTYYDEVTYQSPLLSTAWDQESGNTHFTYMGCTQPANGYPFTGCVATAVGQVMKYYQYPATGAIFNWSSMPATTGNYYTSLLMLDIGTNLGMTYGCYINGVGGPSLCTAANLRGVMEDYGYTRPTKHDYDATESVNVKADIMNGKPVFFSAGEATTHDRHTWLADGVKESTLYTCHIGEDPEPEEPQSRGLPGNPGTYWTATAGYRFFSMNWCAYPTSANGWFGMGSFWFGSYHYSYDIDYYRLGSPVY